MCIRDRFRVAREIPVFSIISLLDFILYKVRTRAGLCIFLGYLYCPIHNLDNCISYVKHYLDSSNCRLISPRPCITRQPPGCASGPCYDLSMRSSPPAYRLDAARTAVMDIKRAGSASRYIASSSSCGATSHADPSQIFLPAPASALAQLVHLAAAQQRGEVYKLRQRRRGGGQKNLAGIGMAGRATGTG